MSPEPRSITPLRTRSHFSQRRGAVDFGRRHGPLATVQSKEFGIERSSDGEIGSERAHEVLLGFRNPYESVEKCDK